MANVLPTFLQTKESENSLRAMSQFQAEQHYLIENIFSPAHTHTRECIEEFYCRANFSPFSLSHMCGTSFRDSEKFITDST